MRAFTYARPSGVDEAIHEFEAAPKARYIAGGTNLLDLMKEDVMRPRRLVDVTHLPLNRIEDSPDSGLRLGALVTNSAVAYHEAVQQRYPLLSKAILAGATPQIRNMATVGGNLLQRTRCYYFYDVGTPCNKREPGSGCGALGGFNRIHAILGASEHCIATHPSDMCVALAALGATVRVAGPQGERTIPFGAFHRLPGNTPEIDANLREGELILSVDLPAKGFADHNAYLKIRDRASYAFALVSVAAALSIEDGAITDARIALGGVAHKPWRDPEAEAMLVGKPATPESFRPVADLIVRDAQGYGDNDFKIELARRAIVRALSQAAVLEPEK